MKGYGSFLLLISSLFQIQLSPQTAGGAKSVEEKVTFATNRAFSKGGIGIVNTHLYIVVKTERKGRNELVVRPTNGKEATWRGKAITDPETVFFYDGKLWPFMQALPDGFDLSQAILISFEKDEVRFFDFGSESGAYYSRILTD